LPPPPQFVRSLPVVGERIATAWQNVSSASPEDIAERVRPHLRLILGWLIVQAGGLAVFFVQLVLTVVLSAILYAQGETVAGGVLAFSRRLAGQAGERVAVLSAQAIRAVALGIVVTALVQAIIGGVGLAVTGVPHAMVLAAIMFVLGVAQIGPIPVLLGSIIYLYWIGEPLWGTVMVGWSIVTGSLDNFLRPVLIRRGADLPLLLIFAGVLGGLLAFGVVGLFIGPVVLAVTYTLLQNWVTSGPPPEPAAPDVAR
jgi:predicted PurR-regulated permease PerM